MQVRTVNEYAAQMNVTPNHLNETVKGCTGRTASDLIKDKVVVINFILHKPNPYQPSTYTHLLSAN